ncbi:MAG: NAD-dependent epimerase/dehydratase family protein [Stellaceae bacterium]
MLQHLNSAPLPPKRVVVLGAYGFVGNAIAARLEKDGVSVLRLGRGDVDLLAADAAGRLAAHLREGDVLVAVAALAPCKNAAMLRDNVIMAAAIVAAAGAVPLAQVINVSSDAVYADSDVPLTEASTMAPQSLHGVMHLARELMFASEVTAPLAMVRPSLIYGAGDPHNGYGPNRFRRLANKGEPIILFGNGEERRDHVLIDDVAELAVRVIYRRSTGALNIATGVVASFWAIAETVLQLAGKTVPVKQVPRVGPMPHGGYRPFDVTACRLAFPDFTFVPLNEGLAAAQRAEEALLSARYGK